MSVFSKKLLHWHKHFNTREMPWKGEKDPYKIWLSEIILQQTRVEQGWNYYEKFIKKYPTVCDLAGANDKEVFKLWEGLGYYNRCKNLLFTARYICNELKGIFPKDYDAVIALKGVGSYTASAICSFAYNQPYAVVDGNVFRVLSRVYGIEEAIDSTAGKSLFAQIADQNIDKKEPAFYNQAIMDFGATICKPANPLCGSCVMKHKCVAHKNGSVHLLPIKEKTLLRKSRFFTWFVLSVNDEIYIHLRTGKDIWQNLHEFYLVETENKMNWDTAAINDFFHNQLSAKPLSVSISKEYSQELTHQKIKAVFIQIELKSKPVFLREQLWIPKNKIENFAFPKIIKDYLH